MSATVEVAVRDILGGAISPITQQSILGRLGPLSSRPPRALSERERDTVLGILRVSLRLFARDNAETLVAACERALRSKPAATVTPAQALVRRIQVTTEGDITSARHEAWAEASRLGVPTFAAVKIATAVSELARNIVFYAGHGVLEIEPIQRDGGVHLRIVASDRGPGIDAQKLRALEDGTYRSERGMGRGLMAVKKLTDRFELDTAPGLGTKVTCEFRVPTV